MRARVFPGWWQVAVALIVNAVSAAAVFTSYSVVAGSLEQAFEPSRMVLMLGITVTMLAAGIMSPVLGKALDRVSVRWMMLVGSLFLAAGFFLLSFTLSMIQVLGIYLVFMSVGSILLGPMASAALLARWFIRRRGLAMGIAASGTAIGGLLIPPLLQGLIDFFEWRVAFRVFAGIILVLSAPLVGLFVIDRPGHRNLYPDGDPEPEPAETGADQAPVQSLSTGDILSKANFWMITITVAAIFSTSTATTSNLIPYVTGLQVEATMGAFLLSVLSGANFVGKLLCSAAADRFDSRFVLAGILLVLACSLFVFWQAEGYRLLVVASAIMGISAGGGLPVWSVLLARVYGPNNIGRVMGLMSLFTMPFTLVSPPLFGWIYDWAGSYEYAFIGYGILLILIVPFALRINANSQSAPAAVQTA